jgi:hypothetical protein
MACKNKTPESQNETRIENGKRLKLSNKTSKTSTPTTRVQEMQSGAQGM